MTGPCPDSATPSRRRRRVAGGTLGLSAIAVAVVVALGGTGATAPARARARVEAGHHARVVTIRVGSHESITTLNASLARRYHELVFLYSKAGAAKDHAPILCTKVPGSHPRGPRIQVLAGHGNTEVAPGNSGGGTFHLTSCTYQNVGFFKTGATGTTGA